MSSRIAAAPGLRLRQAMLAACVLACLPVSHAGATTLVEAWRAAQQNDPGFAAAQAAAAAGEARQGKARALSLPSVSLTAAAGRATGETDMTGAQFSAPGMGTVSGASFSTSVSSGTLSRYALTARQPLWNRELQAQRKQLSLGAEAAAIELDNARQQLVLQVAERYFDVVVAEETVRLLKQQHLAIERSQRESRERYDAGDIPIVDAQEAAARWASVRRAGGRGSGPAGEAGRIHRPHRHRRARASRAGSCRRRWQA